MVRPEGLGPSVLRLKVECFTTKLWAHMVDKIGVEPIPTVFQTVAHTGYATCPYLEIGMRFELMTTEVAAPLL